MTHAIRQVDYVEDKAEGDCFILISGNEVGIPYNTELASSQGVWIHFWLGDRKPTDELLKSLERAARNARDIVRLSWSKGQPTAYWARADI